MVLVCGQMQCTRLDLSHGTGPGAYGQTQRSQFAIGPNMWHWPGCMGLACIPDLACEVAVSNLSALLTESLSATAL